MNGATLFGAEYLKLLPSGRAVNNAWLDSFLSCYD